MEQATIKTTKNSKGVSISFYVFPREASDNLYFHINKFGLTFPSQIRFDKNDQTNKNRFSMVHNNLYEAWRIFEQELILTDEYAKEQLNQVQIQSPPNKHDNQNRPIEKVDPKSEFGQFKSTDSNSGKITVPIKNNLQNGPKVLKDNLGVLEKRKEHESGLDNDLLQKKRERKPTHEKESFKLNLIPVENDQINFGGLPDNNFSGEGDDLKIAVSNKKNNRPRLIRRKIILIEYINCTQCLDNSDLKSFVMNNILGFSLLK